MTPEEKAKSLVFKFTYQRDDEHENYIARQCAIDCVDEIDLIIQKLTPSDDEYCYLQELEYWQEVKIQIQEL